MKKIILLGLVVMVLVGCAEKRVLWDDITRKGDFFYYESKLLNGVCFNVFDNGQLMYEYNCKDGKKDGVQRTWFDNGQLHFESNWKDGERNGLHREWDRNGQLLSSVNFRTKHESDLTEEERERINKLYGIE